MDGHEVHKHDINLGSVDKSIFLVRRSADSFLLDSQRDPWLKQIRNHRSQRKGS